MIILSIAAIGGVHLPDFYFLAGSRGKDCLVYRNCIFLLNRKSKNRRFWICSDYFKTSCKCRCITEDEALLKRPVKYHNHPEHVEKIRQLQSDRIRELLNLANNPVQQQHQQSMIRNCV